MQSLRREEPARALIRESLLQPGMTMRSALRPRGLDPIAPPGVRLAFRHGTLRFPATTSRQSTSSAARTGPRVRAIELRSKTFLQGLLDG